MSVLKKMVAIAIMSSVDVYSLIYEVKGLRKKLNQIEDIVGGD